MVCAELTAAMTTGLHIDVSNIKTDVQDVGAFAKEAQDSLKRRMSILEERMIRKLKPLMAVQEMTKGVTKTLCMHIPEHFIRIDDRVKAVEGLLQQPETKVVALVGMGGVGE